MTQAIYNPNNRRVELLPKIFGFNNGSGMGGVIGVLIAEDGSFLGSHASSHEGWLPQDLGTEEGYRPDRHETFKKHYPGGYRMEFVGYKEIKKHKGLQEAFKLNKEEEKMEKAMKKIEVRAAENRYDEG